MNWWQRLKKNSLARFGAVLLLVFYVAVIAADFVGPLDPYVLKWLIAATQIYWRNSAGSFVGPHIYPTTQGPTELEAGDRKLLVDRKKPLVSPVYVRSTTTNCFG